MSESGSHSFITTSELGLPLDKALGMGEGGHRAPSVLGWVVLAIHKCLVLPLWACSLTDEPKIAALLFCLQAVHKAQPWMLI